MNTIKKHVLFLNIFFILIIFYHIYLYSIEDHFTIWNNLYGIVTSFVPMYGGIFGLLSIRKFKKDSLVSKAILLLSISAVFYGVATLTWGLVATFTHDDLPYPSISDLFYTVYYFIAGAGALLLLKIYSLRFNSKVFLQFLGILIISGYITFHFLGLPGFDNSDPYTSIFDTFYVLGDFFLFAITLIALLIAGGKMTKSILFLVISFTTQIIGDFFFLYMIENDLFWDGSYGDFFFTLSGLTLSIGIIYLVRDFYLNRNTSPQSITQYPKTQEVTNQ